MARPEIPAQWRITEPCVREGMPSEIYHACPVVPEPALSAGTGHTLTSKTPLHAWAGSARLNPDHEAENKTTFDLGKTAHALLTGEAHKVRVIDADDWRTKAAKEERDAAYEKGETPLLKADHARVLKMVRAVREQMRATGIGDPFEAGVCEASLFWKAEGVWHRCRPDAIVTNEGRAGGVIYDLKTTAEAADPVAWVKRAYAFGIDLRAALYIDGMKALFGGEWLYRFIPIEKAEPHALSVLELDEDALLIGRKKLAEARRVWRECLDAGKWPAWPSRVMIVSAPIWEERKWLEREERNEALRAMNPSGTLIDAAIQWQGPGRTA